MNVMFVRLSGRIDFERVEHEDDDGFLQINHSTVASSCQSDSNFGVEHPAEPRFVCRRHSMQ